jgi:hypothetical protein
LTISASDKYGLPTALDDEVVLGLIQITRSAAFRSRQIAFSRYELLHILGWRDEGKSYRRLETSLKRWLGVTLYYDRAWWDKDQQTWVDENFHILNRVVLYHQPRNRKRSMSQQSELPLSFFVWNEVVFRSFQAGYLKALDMEVYRRLKRPVTKRMYRFLDKRFYRGREVTFDLFRFAREHIGLSRCYDAGQLKRRLNLAIDELVDIGFLDPIDHETRYRRIRRGQWDIVLRKKRGITRKVEARQGDSTLESELAERGISHKAAAKLCTTAPSGRIRQKIELYDWHVGKHRPLGPGWLRRAIEEDYRPPAGFETKAEKKSREKAAAVAERRTAQIRQTGRQRKQAAASNRRRMVDHYLESLSDADRLDCEEAALESASPFTRNYYYDLMAEGRSQTLAASVHRQVVEEYVLKRLQRSRVLPDNHHPPHAKSSTRFKKSS